MALAVRTKDLWDKATGPPLRKSVQTSIAAAGALGAREIQCLDIQLGDKQASLTIQTAFSSGSALATTAAGYPRTMTALAMILGSYDAARDWLADPTVT